MKVAQFTPFEIGSKPNQATQRTAGRRDDSQHVYEIRPRKDHHGVDLVSDALPFGAALATR